MVHHLRIQISDTEGPPVGYVREKKYSFHLFHRILQINFV
ncbi:hypothetical protein T12_1923 [Trichinella patagoniensis]|uniref:Uncharacterized protein n=1 Tax=Trichinella patagoniensis TaxID=990121 RepID=A0A0V0Z2F2_9BILA|nr:hypothetical protein T12_1923 [Trichinella patagoniensis]